MDSLSSVVASVTEQSIKKQAEVFLCFMTDAMADKILTTDNYLTEHHFKNYQIVYFFLFRVVGAGVYLPLSMTERWGTSQGNANTRMGDKQPFVDIGSNQESSYDLTWTGRKETSVFGKTSVLKAELCVTF